MRLIPGRAAARPSAAAALTLVLAAAGCSQAGGLMGQNQQAYDPSFLSSHLVDGKTTRDEVAGWLGQPTSRSVSSAAGVGTEETWQYSQDGSGSTSSMSRISNMFSGAQSAAGAFGMGGGGGLSAASGAYGNGMGRVDQLRSAQNTFGTGTTPAEGSSSHHLLVSFDPQGVVRSWNLD